MARRKKADEPEKSDASKAKGKLLVRIRDRYKVMLEADQENRREAEYDLRFANEPGAQWDENQKQARGDRLSPEFNKVRINGKRVINEIRANRPRGKVRAVEDGDKDIARLYEGLCRNIANVSDFDTVTDQAAEYQVDAGMAAWRIVTEYADDDAFDQDIRIKPFKNPFCVYVDPACQDVMKRDAEDWIITERISKRAYEARWPKAEKVDFESSVEFDDEDEWEDDESVRICEYWYKEPYEKEIWLIRAPDGKPITVDMTTDEGQAIKAQGVEPIKRRTVTCHKIKMAIVSGDAVLEEGDWAGTQFPFVMIYGEYKVIAGKARWWGLHRFAKDAQRSYNLARASIDERIALTPQFKYWATAEQAKGLEKLWARAHMENFPWMPYNPDPRTGGGPPQMMPGADVPVALLQQAQVAAQDLRDVTGLHEASFGEESGEKSGIALARKQNQAQIVTYNFPDNMAKGIRRTWEILVDLIPHVYDAERELRILGHDDAEDYARVNVLVQDPKTGQTIRVNDMTHGKYDVAVTVGPNFATQRMESAEIYSDLAAKNPALMQVAGDLVFKSMDLPYADEMAKRWQAILPPQIQQQLTEGKEVPPEAQAVLAQANQAMAMVQQQTQLVQQAAQEVEQSKAASEQAKANVEKAIASLEVKRAQFDAEVTKQLSEIAIREAAITQQVAGKDIALQRREMALENERQTVATDKEKSADLEQFKQQIDEMTAAFMDAAAQAIASIQGEVSKPKPKLKSAKTKRVNGELIAEAMMDDGTMRGFRAKRVNGELVAEPIDADVPTASYAAQ